MHTTEHTSSPQRSRAVKKPNGMKEVRFLVPDPNSRAFRAQVAREAKLLKGAPEEREALAFIEAAMHEYWPETR